ncbi:hypothetical protein [Streptomyces sp. NPDC048385]|uniref:hypothetical protein n=1 Tax=Streptomyces sp. NPDC048385 TaxID=3155145 RepID=UPI003419BA11
MAGNAGKSGQDPRTTLELLLSQQPKTYEEIARDFGVLARKMGEDATLTARHLRRLASGQRSGVNPVTRRVLQMMFGKPLEELLSPWDGTLVAGSTPSGLVISTGHPTADKELINVAAQRARRFALTTGQTDLTPEAMEQVHADVRRLAMEYPQRPLSELLPDMIEAQDTIYTLLERQRRPGQARQLL